MNPEQLASRMKRLESSTERHNRHQRVYVYAVALGFLLICLGLAIKALWSL